MDELLREMAAIMIGRQLIALFRRRIRWLRLARQWVLLSLSLVISVLIGWWLMEQEQERERRRSALVYSGRRGPEIALPPAGDGDDLTVIEGIGPTYARALKASGIATYADLARQNPAELSQLLEGRVSAARIRNQDWIGQARQLRRQ
jgi:predicted flap endonuclease-1-like 5' DNA nuclease